MASNSSSCVIRRERRPLEGSFRHYPYATGSSSGKDGVKEEILRRLPIRGPVSERLLRVMHDVYFKHIKPKNGGVYLYGGNSAQWELISSTWQDFADGLLVLHHLVSLLKARDFSSFDDRLLSSAIAKYKQVLKKLDDSAMDVSEEDGFARETMESNISDIWKSLFVEAEEATPAVERSRIFRDLFQPIVGNPEVRETMESNIFDMWKSLFVEAKEATPGSGVERSKMFCDLFQPIVGQSLPRRYGNPEARETRSPLPDLVHREIHALTACSPYILREDFAKQELKEEVVRLGVELSLYVAESMFLLSDDIRSMLLFCNKVWVDAIKDLSRVCPVLQRLLCVMHHVHTKYIKPKNGVYVNDGKNSVQWKLTRTTWENFVAGFKDLDLVVSILRRGKEESYSDGREFTSSIEEALKKIEDKLSSAKAVAEVNGFAREAMESDILVLWKSLFDKQTQDAWALAMIRRGIIHDMFSPLVNERLSAAAATQ